MNPGVTDTQRLIGGQAPFPERASSPLALRPAALFDGVSAALIATPTVHIDRGRIVEIATGWVELPAAATVVDLDGCTLLPGLVDTHVHLCFDGGPDPIGRLGHTDAATVLEGATEAARQQLRAGVTTVRDLGDLDYVTLGLRDRATLAVDLPTIVCAGPPITTPGGHCHFLGGAATGVDGMRAAVREHAERGVDVIKVMAGGGFLTPGSSAEVTQLSVDELRAVVDEAHRRGLAVTAHAHDTTSIATAVEAGVDGIEHCTFITRDGVEAPDELVERIARRRIVVGATVGILPDSVPPPFIADRLPAILANHARLHRAGAPVVAGTDAGIGPIKPHGVLPHAARHLADMGFTAHETLRSMTAEAARVIGLGDRKGRIAPGFDADLLAVHGDPLTDVAALLRPVAVYRGGRPVGPSPAGRPMPEREPAEERRW